MQWLRDLGWMWLFGWVFLLTSGCGTPAAGADASAPADADPATTDAAAADADAVSGPACPGGTGCACSAASDCALGLCLPTAAGLQCAGPCGAGCSGGQVCVPVAAAGGDVQTVCVDRHARACQPCQANSDCAQPGVSGSACVDNGEGPWFCAPDCSAAADCPAGWRCAAAPDASGAVAQRCLPPAQDQQPLTCPCTPLAVQLAAQGRCSGAAVSSGGLALRCTGLARCEAPGATPVCQADAADPNQCVDVQCLDAVDGTPCDDANPCSSGDACQAGQCQPGSPSCACEADADCAASEDGDVCNGTLRCDLTSHTCQPKPASAVVCSQQGVGACEQRVCVPQTGQCQLQPVADGKGCEDGEACTLGDSCQQGTCQPGANACACQSNADCAGQPTNLCFGSLYCDKSAIPYACKPNPATAVVCSAAQNTACQKNLCQPTTGQCQLTAVADGTPCQDGFACTQGDSCASGGCQPGTSTCDCALDSDCTPYEDNNLCNGTLFCNVAQGICQLNPATAVYCSSAGDGPCQTTSCVPTTGQCQTSPKPAGTACEDGNLCTLGDSCQGGACAAGSGQCACQSDADCAAQEDGNQCNGTLFCNQQTGSCQVNPASIVVCEAGDAACTTVSCEPATGSCISVPRNDGLPCKDSDPCTIQETCSGGVCTSTTSTCACKSDADCEAQEDGDLCNGTLYCDKTTDAWQCKIKPLSVVSCPPAAAGGCTVPICDPASGACVAVPLPDGATCSDGVACTSADVCASGVCAGGLSVCECSADSDCAAKDDGDPCTGVWFCNKAQFPHVCQLNPTSVVQCSSANDTACLRNRCDPQTATCALVPEPPATPCQDGNPCTQDDGCVDGSCVGATPKPCPDPSPCQTAQCAPASGQCLPVAKTDGLPCTDGNNCTQQDQCQGGSCKGSVDPCDDANPCTLDSCKVGLGCQHQELPDFSACTLQSDCGATTFCSQGVCILQGAPCETGNPCLQGTCGDNDQCVQSAAEVPQGGYLGCATCAFGQCYQGSHLWSAAPGQVAIGGGMPDEPEQIVIYAFGDGAGQIAFAPETGQPQFAALASGDQTGVFALGSPTSTTQMQVKWLGWGWTGDGSPYGLQPGVLHQQLGVPTAFDAGPNQPAVSGHTVCVQLEPFAEDWANNIVRRVACMGRGLYGMTGDMPVLEPLLALYAADGQTSAHRLQLVATGPNSGPYLCTLRQQWPYAIEAIRCHANPATFTDVQVPEDVHEVVLTSTDGAPPQVAAARRVGGAPFALVDGLEQPLAVSLGQPVEHGRWSLLDAASPGAWAGPDGQLWIRSGLTLVQAPLPTSKDYWRPVDARVFGNDPCLDGGAVRTLDSGKWQTWAWGKPMYDAFVTTTPVDFCQPFLLVDGG